MTRESSPKPAVASTTVMLLPSPLMRTALTKSSCPKRFDLMRGSMLRRSAASVSSPSVRQRTSCWRSSLSPAWAAARFACCWRASSQVTVGYLVATDDPKVQRLARELEEQLAHGIVEHIAADLKLEGGGVRAVLRKLDAPHVKAMLAYHAKNAA